MKFIRSITDVFGESPFRKLHDHAEVAGKAAVLLRDAVVAYSAEDFEKVENLRKEIESLEYEADKIKHEIREKIPKSLMMPVDRHDLLSFLKPQDSIADACEHAAQILTFRKIRNLPDVVKKDLEELASRIINTIYKYEVLVDELSELILTSFSKKEVQESLEMVPEIENLEHQCDKIELRLYKEVMNCDKLDPVDVLLLISLIKEMGEIANSTARAADRFRTMVLGK